MQLPCKLPAHLFLSTAKSSRAQRATNALCRWTNSRQAANLSEILTRLDLLEAAGVTVVAGAGMMPADASEPGRTAACKCHCVTLTVVAALLFAALAHCT